MTNAQQNKLAMYLAVLGVMDKYKTTWTALTAIADMVSRLQDLASSIQEASGIQGSPLTGIAGGKRRKRMEMMKQALALAGDLHSFAVKNGDSELQAKMDFTLTDLIRLGDTEIAPRCQEIHDLANTNLAALADFGVDAADVTALQNAIDAYKPLITAPRQAVGARKEVTGDIADDENSADTLLHDELDRSMRKFETKNAPFFGEYTTARMIVDLGSGGGNHNPPNPPTPPAPPK